MSGSEQQGVDRGRSRWLKAVLLTLLIAVTIVVLFTWVFPWVEQQTQDPTIGTQLFRLPR
jgi:hypothetical protein